MATHSSILAWKIPRTEEPGGHSPRGRKESDMTGQLNDNNFLLNEKVCDILILSFRQSQRSRVDWLESLKGQRKSYPPRESALWPQGCISLGKVCRNLAVLPLSLLIRGIIHSPGPLSRQTLLLGQLTRRQVRVAVCKEGTGAPVAGGALHRHWLVLPRIKAGVKKDPPG